MSTVVRLGVIDDHRAISAGVLTGLEGLVVLDAGSVQATTVEELTSRGQNFDVVLLDVWLADASAAEENVRRLVDRGWRVLLFTQERRPAVLGRCFRAGALGMVGKHEDWDVLAEAVATLAAGEQYLNADWAAAVESMSGVPELAPREAQVLKLYATGLPMKSVARRVGIAEETAKEYLSRLRRKYQDVGRPAPTKTDLYRRAVEDGHLPSPGDG